MTLDLDSIILGFALAVPFYLVCDHFILRSLGSWWLRRARRADGR